MLKKLLMLLFTAVVGLSFASTASFASAAKGQKIFIKFLKKPCGIGGAEMAGKHTQDGWKKFQDEGTLSEEIARICPKAKPLKKKHVPLVYKFLHNYASDSGNVPA